VNHTGTNPPNNPKTSSQTTAVAIIPARYDSARLPGKALLEISGKPMICWVVERALAARRVVRAIVATDNKLIREAVTAAGYEAIMTSPTHASGTDRIAEVADQLDEAQIIVNIQGDEPLISPATIDRAIAEMGGDDPPGIVTTWEAIDAAADVVNPAIVKVVLDETGRALYFSRSPVPFPREAVRRHGTLEAALTSEPELLSTFRKHTGLYVYRRDVLQKIASWPQSRLEQLESLEQLRALEHGVHIRAIEASTNSIGVDTSEDLARVREKVSSLEFRVSS
jgi:3-deoxy-manno-octulosonate cytidylyltransferase (CMP-KDO synthetase)